MAIFRKKIPGGKLLIINIRINNGKIAKLCISGDFFLYPERKIYLMENQLIGTDIKSYSIALKNIISEHKIKLLGIGIKDIIDLIKLAFNEYD